MAQALAGSLEIRQSPGLRGLATRLISNPTGRLAVRLFLVTVVLALWEYLPMTRGTRLWFSSPSHILSMFWGWVLDGSIRAEETIVDGLTAAPEALNMLFDGANHGKTLGRVA